MYALIAFLLHPTVSTCWHNFRSMIPTSSFILPQTSIRLYFGANTTWYRQRQLVCSKLLPSTSFMNYSPCSCKLWSANLFLTLTRRLFLVIFSPRHRLFLPPAEPGVVFGCQCRKSRTSALLFPMQRYTVPVTVTVVCRG